jgi:restriction endonuclease Mrr
MNVGKQEYRFLGLLELLRSYPETQVDTNGQPRKVWLFEFRIHPEPSVVPIDCASVLCAQILADSRKTVSELEREVAGPSENQTETEIIPFPAIEKLRAQMFQAHPVSFERLVKELMEASRFVNVSVTKVSGDGGIDVNAFVGEADDYFAGTHVQVQVKRWRHAVGSVEINSFRGALDTTAKGVFVTTSHYTRAAMVEARLPSKPCITLIDGSRFASMVMHSRIDCKALL